MNTWRKSSFVNYVHAIKHNLKFISIYSSLIHLNRNFVDFGGKKVMLVTGVRYKEERGV